MFLPSPSLLYVSPSLSLCFPHSSNGSDKVIETMNYPDTNLPDLLLHLLPAPLPLSTPHPTASTSTVTLFRYLHLYCFPVPLPLPVPCRPCFLKFLLYPAPVLLLPHLSCPCSLTPTSTMPLFPYFHLYCAPVHFHLYCAHTKIEGHIPTYIGST